MLNQVTFDYFPLLPGWSITLIAAILLALVAWGAMLLARKQVPQRWVVGLGLARVAAVLLFAACLLQPTISYLRMQSRPPELLVLVDTSQSMGQTDAAGDRTRLAAATDGMQRAKFLETLREKFKLTVFNFDRRAYPVDAADLSSLKPQGPATAFATSFASAVDLLAAEEDEAASSAAPQRVLLVSDGHDRGNESLAAAAARVGTVVDVLPVGGEPVSTANEAIVARVQAPSRVLLASETQFHVTLERGDDAAQTYVLTMLEDGQAAQTQEVAFAAGVHELRTTLAYRPTETGLKHYEFTLRPKNEAVAKNAVPETDDESYGVNVQVIDDKLELLVLEDRWRWEFKYFKRVIEDDPSFNLTAMLARGGGAFVQMGEPERSVNLGSFPQSRAELDWFDIVVLGDARPTRWPSGLSGAIADSVIEGGKSLIVVAGPALSELAQVPELQGLLPVELSLDSATPIEGPLDVRLTPEGAQSGLFADGDRGTIVALPTVDRIYAPLRKRPGATVLVEAASEANAAGPLILLAEQTVGRGRVLYVGTDTLWKWQSLAPADEEGRTLYGKFWQQAVRALTPHRTAASALWLAADRSRYEAGDRVTLRAEVPAVEANERMKLEASVVLPDERRIPLTFEPDPNSPTAYVAEFDAVAAGRYRVALAATIDGQVAAETSIALEATSPRGETDDAGVDRAALAEIASRTGGKVVDLSDPQTWPTTGDGPPPQVEERRTVNLWENFTILTLLCLVLGGDWLVRLMRGYV